MFDSILEIAKLIGIIVFCVSVSLSLDAIAKQLKRLADARDRTGAGPGQREP